MGTGQTNSGARPGRGQATLTREHVLEHALTVLDRYGFADLSMRRLATSLGVAPGALYWHFANKQTLLASVAEAILAGREDPGLPVEGPWEPQLRAWAHALRRALLSRRDGAEVVASVLAVRPSQVDPAGEPTRVLTAHGVPPAQARAAAMALLHFVMGHTVDEQGNAAMAEFGVAEAVDTEAQERFAYGLDVMLDGLACRMPRAHTGQGS